MNCQSTAFMNAIIHFILYRYELHRYVTLKESNSVNDINFLLSDRIVSENFDFHYSSNYLLVDSVETWLRSSKLYYLQFISPNFP